MNGSPLDGLPKAAFEKVKSKNAITIFVFIVSSDISVHVTKQQIECGAQHGHPPFIADGSIHPHSIF